MSKADSSAFPYPYEMPKYPGTEGLTKREYFAAQFMAAIIGKHKPVTIDLDETPPVYGEHARGVLAYADALITELEKSNEAE